MSRWISIESSLKQIVNDCSFFLNCETLDKSPRDVDDLVHISDYAQKLLNFTQRRDDLPDILMNVYVSPDCVVQVPQLSVSEFEHFLDFPAPPEQLKIFDFEV